MKLIQSGFTATLEGFFFHEILEVAPCCALEVIGYVMLLTAPKSKVNIFFNLTVPCYTFSLPLTL